MTIRPVVSEIESNKNRDTGDRQMEMNDVIFRTLGVTKHQRTSFLRLRLGRKWIEVMVKLYFRSLEVLLFLLPSTDSLLLRFLDLS